MPGVLVVVMTDVIAAIFLLLSVPRQRRHREAVVAVASFLLFAATVLAIAART